MNYIYDVLLDFKEVLYDFYEWNKEDDIQHIRKIPVLKVESKVIEDMKQYKIKVNSTFLDKFKNKTERFSRKTVEPIEYALIFTDGKEAIATLFKNSETHRVSKMLLDEEEDLLEMSTRFEKTELFYKKTGQIKKDFYITRREFEQKEYTLKKLYKMQDMEQMKYLYFECFDKAPLEETFLKKTLIEKVEQNYKTVGEKVYNFFKLVSTKK